MAAVTPFVEEPAGALDPASVILALVVDDDRTNRIVLAGLLRRLGWSVMEADSGEQAVDLFADAWPDIVFMDVMMPVVDGYEATRRIKQLRASTPVIFLTALDDDEVLTRCLGAGGDDFLAKPVNPQVLEAKARAALRTKQMYDTMQRQRDRLAEHEARVHEDFAMAQRIFERLKRPAALTASNVDSMFESVDLLNGDIMLAAQKPTGGQIFLVGDSTGHGLPAAIGAMTVYDIFFTMAKKGFSILEMAQEINAKLRQVLPTGRFMAAAFIELDSAQGQLAVLNAGMPDVLLVDHAREVRHRVVSTSLPLGVLPRGEFEASPELLRVEEAERIYLYSDGLVEACAADGQMFGQSRLEAVIAEAPGPRVGAIREALNRFLGGMALMDDITLLEVRVDPVLEDADADAEMRTVVHREPANWKISLELEEAALRTTDPLPLLMQTVVDLQGLDTYRPRLYTVLAEAYSNALEHGLLGLDSTLKHSAEGFADYYARREQRLASLADASLAIEVENRIREDGGTLFMRVRHNGAGFDHEALLSGPRDDTRMHGRGIAVMRSLCRDVAYSDGGRALEVAYDWPDTGQGRRRGSD